MALIRARGAAIAAIVALTAGCTAPGAGVASPTPTSPALSPTTSQQSPSAGPTESARVATFAMQRTGGIAGVDDRITVDAQGRWTSTNRAGKSSSGQLTADQLSRLQTLAKDPRLPGEANRPASPSKCRDAFNYVVTVNTTTIRFTDCPSDPDQPDAAKAIVDTLTAAIPG
jgi:hypothetical protein